MRTLIWIYIGLYALLCIVMAVVHATLDEEEKDPPWEQAIVVTVLLLGFVGMLFYQRPIAGVAAALQSLWKVVVPALVIVHVLFAIRDARDIFGKDGTYSEDGPVPVWIGLVLTLLLLLPSLWLNCLYAYP